MSASTRIPYRRYIRPAETRCSQCGAPIIGTSSNSGGACNGCRLRARKERQEQEAKGRGTRGCWARKSSTEKNMRTLDLASITLSTGAHEDFEQGACLLEAASYLAGEPWSDHPTCVGEVIAALGRALNDGPFAQHLHLLVPYIPRIIGTRSTEDVERRRGYRCADWAIHVAAPMALESAGLAEHAATLRALPAVVDEETAARAADSAARAAAWAASAAAWAASAARAARAASAAEELRTSALALLDELIAMLPVEVAV
jgi:hypothetical protein